MLLVALATTGCNGSSGTRTAKSAAAPSTATSSSAPTDSGERRAAEAYFAAMAPTIDMDYEGMQWFEQATTQWQQAYANNDPTTDRQVWTALGLILQQAVSKVQEIVQGYEAVTPPEAFRTAHAALIENNRDGNAWAEALIAAIKANRPTSELMSTLGAGPPGPSNAEVLATFRVAAARVGIELPTKLIDTYSDSTGLGGQSI